MYSCNKHNDTPVGYSTPKLGHRMQLDAHSNEKVAREIKFDPRQDPHEDRASRPGSVDDYG